MWLPSSVTTFNRTVDRHRLVSLSRNHCISVLTYFAAEFTQHQRDVFCVFSGNMVSKFRDFLNTSPQFEDLRESFPRGTVSFGRIRMNNRSRAQALTAVLNGVDGEGFDEEMADEDNDFEGMDGSEMTVDANALPLNTALHGPSNPPPPAPVGNPPLPGLAANQQTPPLPPLRPFRPGHPPAYSYLTAPPPPMDRVAFSSYTHNEPSDESPPPSTLGYAQQAAQASMASIGQAARAGLSSASMAGGGPSGASTASMHQQPRQDAIEQQGLHPQARDQSASDSPE